MLRTWSLCNCPMLSNSSDLCCNCAGASNGINKNFETVQEVLKDFVTFHEYGKQPAAGKVWTPLIHYCSAASSCSVLHLQLYADQEPILHLEIWPVHHKSPGITQLASTSTLHTCCMLTSCLLCSHLLLLRRQKHQEKAGRLLHSRWHSLKGLASLGGQVSWIDALSALLSPWLLG